MEWSDEGIVLSVRKLGEGSAVLCLLTREHGRHGGLVRGRQGALQPGTRVSARWRGRLADQLGAFTCEPARTLPPAALADPRPLCAIAAACAMMETAVPEREPVPGLFEHLVKLLESIPADASWPARYVRWEVTVLAELGWGLDLDRCALTGGREELAFVSPRTGRAVSAAAASPWRDRLLALPAFLVDEDRPASDAELAAGLALTGHFLSRHVYAEQGRRLPAARARLADVLARPARPAAPRVGAEP